MNNLIKAAAVSAITAGSGLAAAHGLDVDFGRQVEALAKLESLPLFGIFSPVGASSAKSLTADQANANPAALVTVARGLDVSVVSAAADLAPNIDMMVLWPNDSAPTHIIACNEQGTAQVGVQRIRLSDGKVENIIASGLGSCDPVEATPWGTVIVGEESGASGRVFEILDPLGTTGVTVTGAGAATSVSDPVHVQFRGALGQLSFEGISVLPNGVVYYQDENRPSSSSAGGGYFKFIPTTLWNGGAPIVSLAQSPLAAGEIYGLRIGRNGGGTDVGPGNHAGRGNWIDVGASTNAVPTNLRAAQVNLKLSAGYRPEDQDIDQRALADGKVRVCGTNTGQDVPDTDANGDNNFGETFCITDGTLAQAASNAAIPEYQILVSHFREFAMPDNIAYQPGRGNWLIHEDGEGPTYPSPRNNDIWDCTDDGEDADQLADACVRIATLNDFSAESTGGVFDARGRSYYFSVQHNVTGHGVILRISGWR